jgi:hypothetical protein
MLKKLNFKIWISDEDLLILLPIFVDILGKKVFLMKTSFILFLK